MTVDNKLSFETHLNEIYKKCSQKLQALARISTHILQKKLRIIMRTFITSRFIYCASVWRRHNTTFNNKIKKLVKGF